MEDILYSSFCSCCVVNQLYQTIKSNRIQIDGGQLYNTNNFLSDNDRNCDECTEGCLLQPCTQGKIMKHAVGMPYVLACCCMNIFTVRSIVRYQYRIKPTFGHDIYDELLVPIGYFFGSMLICNPIIGISLQVAYSAQLLREIKLRSVNTNHQYLIGYQPDSVTDYMIPIEGPISVPVISVTMERNYRVTEPDTEMVEIDNNLPIFSQAIPHQQATVILAEKVSIYHKKRKSERSIFESMA
jgi:hypothetical protein